MIQDYTTSLTPAENVTIPIEENMTSITPMANTTSDLLDGIVPAYNTSYMNTTHSIGLGSVLPNAAKGVIIIGLLANLLTIVVMTTKDLRKVSISRLLLALAVCDSVCLCCNGVNAENIASLMPRYIIINWSGCKAFFWFRLTFSVMSHWLVLVISVERLIAVCLPLKARHINTNMKAYISLAAIMCIAGCYVTVWINQWHGISGACVFANIQGSSRMLYIIYGMVYVIIPIPLLLATNTVIVVTLCRKPLGQIKHRNLTLMLLSTTAFFIVLVSPTAIVFSPRYSASPSAKAITQFLTNVNYAGNFFVYVLVGKRFRKNMRALFRKKVNAVAPQRVNATGSEPGARLASTTSSDTASAMGNTTTKSQQAPQTTTISMSTDHFRTSSNLLQVPHSGGRAMKTTNM